MKRSVKLLLAGVAMLAFLCSGAWAAADVWDGTAKTRPAVDGTTVKITSAAELAWLATGEANSGLTGSVEIDIDADIDLGGHEWTPISLEAYITLKGNGHVIKGLTISSSIASIGLFSCVDGEFTANDLHLVGAELNGGTNVSAIASLVAEVTDCVTILGCTVQGRIYSDSAGAVVGGFVGRARGGATIKRSVADIAIVLNGTSYDSVGGGIIGSVGGGAAKIENCAVYGSVLVKGRAAGGIVGLVSADSSSGASNFRSLTNSAAVTLVGVGSASASASFGAGGVIGVAESTSIEIASSANYGAVKAEGAAASTAGDIAAGAGGLLGTIYGVDMPTGAVSYKLEIGTSANFGAVASTITGAASGGNEPCLGAGGLVGSSCYRATSGSVLAFAPGISRSRNTGAVTGNDTNSAGGMIGYLCTVSTVKGNAATANISSSYNIGAVSAAYGRAGGIVGSLIGGHIDGVGQNTTMAMSQVYSSAVPTGYDAYGFFGKCDSNAIALNITNAKHPNSGTPIAYSSDGGSYAADMTVRDTFVASTAFWNDYLDNGTLPPELDRSKGFESDIAFALCSGTETRLANGDIALRIVELPDGEVCAAGAVVPPYEVSAGGMTIARDLRLAGGVLTIPANDALAGGTVVTIKSGTYEARLSLGASDVPSPDPTPEQKGAAQKVLASLGITGDPEPVAESAIDRSTSAAIDGRRVIAQMTISQDVTPGGYVEINGSTLDSVRHTENVRFHKVFTNTAGTAMWVHDFDVKYAKRVVIDGTDHVEFDAAIVIIDDIAPTPMPVGFVPGAIPGQGLVERTQDGVNVIVIWDGERDGYACDPIVATDGAAQGSSSGACTSGAAALVGLAALAMMKRGKR